MTLRSPQQLRTEIAEGWRRHEADVPRGVRWDDWSDSDRRSYNLKVVYEGMNYGFNGCRLNRPAENILLEANSLDELANTVLDRLVAEGKPIVSGYVADLLNDMGREAAAA